MDTIHKSYLALGDSYTIGESVAATESFPVQTVKLLTEQSIHINNPDIIAATGWTTTNLLDALENSPPKATYSMVTLLIGVNNQYRGSSLKAYRIEFATLLKMAVSYTQNIRYVFVLSIPDYSVTPFARDKDIAKIAKEIAAFNFANKTITHEAGAHYIDITPISRNAEHDPGLLANDKLHPSATQYKRWSELLVPVALHEFHYYDRINEK